MRAFAPVLLGSCVALACAELPSVGEVPEPTAHVSVDDHDGVQAPAGPLIVVHGGQGSPAARSDGPVAAADRGFALLEDDAVEPLPAAIAAIELLEDDPRF